MPSTIVNIMSDNKNFHNIAYDDSLNNDNQPVGVICNMLVYHEFNIKRNQIKLSINKDKMRDLKISSIISNEDKLFEIILEIDTDLI
jgi:hypothetical protein